jgi:exosome complex RNA-binding protein Rrp4
MSTDSVEIIADEQVHLLDELQSLLEKQLELAHQGNPASEQMYVLSRRTDSLVEKIAQTGILDSVELQCRSEKLQKLYEGLCLVIAAQKANVCEELSQIRRGRKTIGTYRNNI